MTELPLYQVDAFASRPFSGNPAAVMPLAGWLDDALLQSLALENNLSETAFLVREPAGSDADFHIRWFTPGTEVPLCGHATLASAWVIFNRLDWLGDTVHFRSLSGPLGVRRMSDGWLELDFPNLPYEPVPTPEVIRRGVPEAPEQAFLVNNDANHMIVLDNEAAVRALNPDLRALKALERGGLIVTAPGEDCDFVSRYFCPADGIDEDPVTGSIHSVLTPYWAERLGRDRLVARQVSARGGELRCELDGDRVRIAGQAIPFLTGTVQLP
ncbi:PhzF family phenazine biosynthesis protein [Marinobacter halodurans]|uniref:PhzF family phenazine biosynthesis protein n=1 Tax=Marinobacter halodurans TaxID=2528979 RepID=A0ABY1ZT07_9GAMM|nr:PhzF family phenazine biosynthesis protein [Marinobacter halodurans]TBW59597.1 PhzF family phenazine biosynthesis protein [Marinobacter halodurans]